MLVSPDVCAIHRLRISSIVRAKVKGKSPRDTALDVWTYILKAETKMGTAFLHTADGTLYVYLGATRQLVTFPNTVREAEQLVAYVTQVYGITFTDTFGRYIFDSFRNYALAHAIANDPRRFAVYDVRAHVGYLTNYQGRMWRLDGGTPMLVDNGTDDVFFINDDGGVSCEPQIRHHGILLDLLTDLNFAESGLSGMTPEAQRQAMIVWLFALAFPDLMPTKPLLILEGTQGSGKSAAVALMQLALMGVSKPMILQRNKEDDFGVILLRSPLAVFDNTDSYIEWVPDAVCAYTTSGQWVKRKLYSNSEEVVIKPHAFIAVASKNPASFRREDVADRCLIMRLERRANFTAFETLRQDVLAQREALLGEYLWYVNQIIAYMRTHGDVMERNETARMADYARFARAVSAVLGWPATTIDDLMASIAHERDTFINEDDPLVQLLEHWVKKNARRPVTVQKLFSDLDALAPMLGATFYKSPRVLAQKVRSPHVERAFKVKMTIREGQKYYEFEPLNALTVVDGGAEPGAAYEPPLLELV
jgi:hypothetical protein